jgi:hypothetical protein
MNLIVQYDSKAGYLSGKNEIHNILTKLGDQKSEQELLVPGFIGVKTILVARNVVEELREMYANDPESVKATVKWVPADYWCDATVEKILLTVKEEVKDLFLPSDPYSIQILPHKTALKSDEIISAIKPWLKGTISDFPQKILRIELFDKKASVTLLKPKDIFSRE